MFFAVFFVAIVGADIFEDRIAKMSLWNHKTDSPAAMTIGWNDSIVTCNMCLHIQNIGRFCDNCPPGDANGEGYARITTDILILAGFSPVRSTLYNDRGMFHWDTSSPDYDIAVADNLVNQSVGWNFATQSYTYKIEGALDREYLYYAKGSSVLFDNYVVQDAGKIKMQELNSAAQGSAQICNTVINACNRTINGVNYLADTGYTSHADCVAFFNTLPASNECPYPYLDDTSTCRGLHATGSWILPHIHCKHTRRVSTVCRKQCSPWCDNMHPNAACVAKYPGLPYNRTVQYTPECKNGYIGNQTHCEPKFCNAQGKCPGLERGSYDCSTGLCMCTSTFTHVPNDPNGEICQCLSPSRTFTNDSDPQERKVCVPEGRCFNGDSSQCKIQNANQVNCVPLGLNIYSPFEHCRCKYGYLGGSTHTCLCPEGKREVGSDLHDGKICIGETECTEDRHCEHGSCTIEAGQPAGHCNTCSCQA